MASTVGTTQKPHALAGERDGSSGIEGGDDARRAKIDVHHHFTAPQWVDWAEREGVVRREELLWWARWDVDSALALMDRVGIATAVLNPTMQDRYRSAAQARDGLSVVFEAVTGLMQEHPGRFAFLCPALLDHPEVTTWALRRAFDEFGAVGVGVKASYNGVYLGDPSYDHFLAEVDERSGVLVTHPLDLPGKPPGVPTVPGIPNFMCDFLLDTTRAAVNMIRTRTLDRYPRLSVVLPHAGGFLPQIATRLEAFGDFCTPPLEAARVREALRRFHYDTAGPLAPACTLVETAGADRILFGTDWPAASAEVITGFTVPAVEADRAFTERQRRGIYRDNARRLMPALEGAAPTGPRDRDGRSV
ncbi:amidohydrolase family protein [Streptomyces phaeofaciens JCM 4814]|uniref:Amidohydrolase n=1 Tax=Streptomyces phaeofaciens TaxID=68254 RepID=A0A918HKB9_9ACTN|nr:amidohydrolase family protein [Streptomyces phaeofaciens]GGT70714.1 amidohydrolase [Streptomyces phaeofaciens]